MASEKESKHAAGKESKHGEGKEPKPAESKAEKPAVDKTELFLKLKRKSGAKKTHDTLSGLSFITKLSTEDESVIAEIVETRDINKNPYLYAIYKFEPEGIRVEYTITPESNPQQRNIDVCANLLSMLSLEGESYGLELGPFYTFMQKALKDAGKNATTTYQQLLNRFNSLEKENRDVSDKFKKMKTSHDELNTSFLELEKRLQVMKDRVQQLEAMTDSELKEELMRWIAEHDGYIKYSDFSKSFNIPQARVEEGVNQLLKEGNLTRVE